jgi:hypothetical protein
MVIFMRIRKLNNYDILDIENIEKLRYRKPCTISCIDELMSAAPNEAFIVQFKGYTSMSVVWKEGNQFFSIVSTDFPELFFRHLDKLDDLLDGGLPVKEALSFIAL